jgi:hypothetical protein
MNPQLDAGLADSFVLVTAIVLAVAAFVGLVLGGAAVWSLFSKRRQEDADATELQQRYRRDTYLDPQGWQQ